MRTTLPEAASRKGQMRTNEPWKSLFLLSFLVTTAACATEPPPRPTRLDPSNPAAAESPPLSVGALSQPPPVSATDARPSSQPTTVYTCPMHPEVISDKPGKCPKCGMTLVPKQPEPKR
jgi:hypothetical protein